MDTCKRVWGVASPRVSEALGYATPSQCARDAYIFLLVCAVALCSYGVGVHAGANAVHHHVVVDTSHRAAYLSAMSSAHMDTIPNGATVVASRKGKKYHYVWCAGAQTIAVKNRRYFVSVDEARSAGFLPAGNCKGLQ